LLIGSSYGTIHQDYVIGIILTTPSNQPRASDRSYLIILKKEVLFLFGICGIIGSWNIVSALLVFGINVIYYLPMIIALKRDRPDKLKIITINILTGWTIIGWIVALRWALKEPS